MADTLTTIDGKMHTLHGSTTLESIVREYARDEAADLVRAEIERNAYEEARAETDLGAYEESLRHWQDCARDWCSTLLQIIDGLLENQRLYTKANAAKELQKLKSSIENEL